MNVRSCPPHLSSYIRRLHMQTHCDCDYLHWEFDFLLFFFCRDCMAAEWYFRERWVGVGGMDGRMTPVSIPTGERKSLSEHNRKETEQKQAHVFLDIKSLPVGLWAASPTIFSLHLSAQFIQPFGRQRYWSSLFFCVCKKCACSCRYVSQLSQITRQ